MPERVLFVHAHPDDETLSTGATIATLVSSGAEVTVLTCTRGELGEIVVDDLRHLDPDGLAAQRERELAAALSALGGPSSLFLGATGARWEGRSERRYRDSGMQWGRNGPEPLAPIDPRALLAAAPGEVASDIAAALLTSNAEVVVTYAADGGYGHPDHVLVHNATRAAASVLGVPLYVIGAGKSAVEVEPGPVLERKRRALEAHRSQLIIEGDRVIVSPSMADPIAAVETFHRLRPAGGGFADYGLTSRIITYLLVFVLGAFVGATFTIVHAQTIVLAGVTVAWGIISGTVITVALLAGLRMVFESWLVPLVCALGLITASVLLAAQLMSAL